MKDDLIYLKCFRVIDSCNSLIQLKHAKTYVELYYEMYRNSNNFSELLYFWRNKYIKINKNIT
jgi:hypothetical protein